MVGSSVELTCAVSSKGHEPVVLNLFWKNGSIKTKALDDFLLPNGKWYKGISTSFENVTSDDGIYTCKVYWENPNYNKSAVFNITILGKYCFMYVYWYHFLFTVKIAKHHLGFTPLINSKPKLHVL